MKYKNAKEVCFIGASGKLGQYLIQHALKHGYEVNAVRREQSIESSHTLVGISVYTREITMSGEGM